MLNASRRLVVFGVAFGVVAAASYAAFDRLMPSFAPKAAPLPGFGGPFSLTNQDGLTVTDADFRGKWLLLYFGYTHCPDACPTALNTMTQALDRLGPAREKIRPVFITLDPERDTPDILKSYIGAFQADIVGLTGSPAQIQAVAKAYRIDYRKHPEPDGEDYTVDHTSVIFLIDPTGEPVALFSHETSPERIANRLKATIG